MTEHSPSDDREIEAILNGYLEAHPGATADEFRTWAAGQAVLEGHRGLVEEVALGMASGGLTELKEVLGSDPGRLIREHRARSAERNSGFDLGAPLASGSRVAHFLLRRCLGRGGMGEVWEAEDESLQRRVALKFILPERVSPKSLDLFEREARAGGRLSHPNLVRTLAFGRDNQRTWLAQELVEGSRTVKDLLEDLRGLNNVPREHYRAVAILVAQLADGLQAAHAAGVIHRDIKPQNILLAPDGAPKLADFGLARVNEDLFRSVTGEFAGTYFYMGPEQVTAKRIGLDHRTDIFSLGAVLYELLSLRRPFEGDTTQQVSHRILFFDPPDPSRLRSQCPRNLSVICGKALAKDPDRRYPSMAEFAADLRRHLSDQPILAKPPGTLSKLRLWTRRHPAPSVAIGLGSVALVVISSLLAYQMRTSQAMSEMLHKLLSLSAQKDCDDLVAAAATLWPAHPDKFAAYKDWLKRADELIRGCPADSSKGLRRRPSLAEHKENLDGLRRYAKPLTAAQIQADQESHPKQAELQLSRAKLQWLSRMLGIEAWPREGDSESAIAQESLPVDADDLNMLAWPLLDPANPEFGQEMRALLLAQHAVAAASASQLPKCRMTLAWALFRVGRLDQAASECLRAQSEPGGALITASAAGLVREIAHWSAEERTKRHVEHEALMQEVASLVGQVQTRQTYEFDDPEKAWWNAQLNKLVEDLVGLQDPTEGLMGDVLAAPFGWGVKKRYAFAQSIAERSIHGVEASRLWAEAIVDVENSGKYGGLLIAPQIGLLPIGKDPHTQLWEFAHLQTGHPAQRGGDGMLILSEETGLVFVLIPGGSFSMGAQKDDPSGINFDPQAQQDEGPIHRVALTPYFLSKFEMTQAQWQRIAAVNPSYYQPPNLLAPTSSHPVEQVSWSMCFELLESLGLSLPSEAQWEYGARGGLNTVWVTGQELESLRGRVNIADLTASQYGMPWQDIFDWPGNEDGSAAHCVVGKYPANNFGLHEVAGNVYEWCRDAYHADFYSNCSEQDPVLLGSKTTNRVYRGGGFSTGASFARSANRRFLTPDSRDEHIGVRPMRRLTSLDHVLETNE